jgi:hypothetical protein
MGAQQQVGQQYLLLQRRRPALALQRLARVVLGRRRRKQGTKGPTKVLVLTRVLQHLWCGCL